MTNNIHDIKNALNAELLPDGFMEAAEKAWCRETCWPGCVAGYPANRDDNPSFGNCLVTTLAAYAARGFQDDLIPSKVYERGNEKNPAWHWRLGIATADPAYKGRKDKCGTVQVDATWQQFEHSAAFCELMCRTPEERAAYQEVVVGSLWTDDTLQPRLALLLSRMRDLGGYDVGYSADEIINKVRESFSFINAPGFVDQGWSAPALQP